ncbi:glycoside hydrolase family 45 protein [Viridothelium virens]|uniref:Glycoside hydrolase family 45 protein n=1 Tax=Viridothelium virens TaxID=1048519 RepID=A0A6A6GSJ8_VIRVR|nr:glycoside hydrolase family 45 protein [Viridothelium virens]
MTPLFLTLLLLSAGHRLVNAGTTYNSTFTFYGSGDSRGDGTCNTNTAACGFFTNPGFSAAISQNLYGAAPGAGAGPQCGTCWRLTAQTNPYNQRAIGTAPIVVKVNNLCPASGNPLCAQKDLSGGSTNAFGGVVDFNLCEDDGASGALFGDSGTGLAVGVAEEVGCAEWNGSVVSQGSGGGGGGNGNTGQGDTGQGDSGNYDSGNYDCGDYDSGNYDGCDGNGSGNGNGNGSGNGTGGNAGEGGQSEGNSQGFIGKCTGAGCDSGAGAGVIGGSSRRFGSGDGSWLGVFVTFGSVVLGYLIFQ